MEANILVLHHHATRFHRRGHVQRLFEIGRRRHQSRSQIGFVTIDRERDAIHRTDIDACVAFDAELVRENSLHVAVEATLRFGISGAQIEAQLDFGANVLQRDDLVFERHTVTLVAMDRVVVAPLVDAHLLREQIHVRRRPLRERLAVAVQIDRDRRIVPVRHGPDDVLRSECSITAEEHVGPRRRHRGLVDDRHVVRVEGDAQVALDPWKRVFLTDGDEHVVAREMNNRLARRHELPPTILVLLRRDFLERDAGQLTVVVRERLGNKIVVDRDALVHRILFFPRRCFHLVEARAHDDVDVLATQPARAAAAIHRGIAAAHHDDAFADRRDMAERHRRQPIDADMNVLARFVAAGNRYIASARRAAADEHCIELLLE